MADTEVIKVLFEIVNPTVLSQIEQLRRAPLNLNINTITDNKLKELLDIKDRKIDVRFSANNDSINKLQERIKELTKPVVINITTKDNFDEIEAKFQRAFVKSKGINAVGYTRAEVASVATDPLLNKVLGTFPAGGNKPTVSQVQDQSFILKQIINQSVNEQVANKLRQIDALKTQQGFVPIGPGGIRQKFIDDYRTSSAPFSDIREGERIKKQQEAVERARQDAIQRFRISGAEFSPVDQEEKRTAAIRKYQLATAPFSSISEHEGRLAKIKEARSSLLKETTIGALRGQGLPELGGSLLGGLAGGAFGGIEGIAFGSAAGGAAVSGAIEALKFLTETLHKASDAGIQFETSILGISSVLQATTRVTGPGGEPLSVGDQLSFQQTQAKGIQTLARRRLLPLGISGEKEATLVQAIISGAAQKGIQLTAEQAATISERLGGTIQAQRPELLSNTGQLRRDVEDLLSNSPANTVLKSLVRGFAPGIGRASSADDLLRATRGLSSFPTSLQESKTNPVVAFAKANAGIDQAITTFGDSLNKALLPAINKFADALLQPEVSQNLEKLGTSIGKFASDVASASITFGEGAYRVLNLPAYLDTLTDSANKITTKTGFGTKDLDFAGNIEVLKAAQAAGLLPEGVDSKKFADIISQAEAAKESAKGKSEISTSTRLNTLFRATFGKEGSLEDLGQASVVNSPLAQLSLLKEQKGLLSKGLVESLTANKGTGTAQSQKELFTDFLRQNLGLGNAQFEALGQAASSRQSLFDTSSPQGSLNALRDAFGFTQQRTGVAESNLNLATQLQGRLSPKASAEEKVKAEEGVRRATEDLIKARKEERDAIHQIREAEISRARVLRESTLDAGTLQGRLELANSALQDAGDRSREFSNQISELKKQLQTTTDPIDRQNILSSIESATIGRNRAGVESAVAGREIENKQLDIIEAPLRANEALSRFGRGVEEGAEKFQKLSEGLTKANQSLDDFDASAKLRALGREGRIVEAAEKADKAFKEAGGVGLAPSERLPLNLQRLVKGNFFFSERARSLFEFSKGEEELGQTARENSPERGAIEDLFARNDLLRNRSGILRDLKSLPLEQQRQKFDTFKNLKQLQQEGFNSPDMESFFNLITSSGPLGVESPLTSAASISGLSTSGDIFDRDLFGEDKSLRRAGPIPNISDLKNVTPSTSGRQIYEGITHGLMDSNSREFYNRHPKYPSNVSVSSGPAGGKESNPQNDLASAIRDNTKAAQDNFQKLESTIKKALESAFGG